jgi:bacillithiol biosynthesis cysteine-adding enzyme BshC
MRTVARVSYQNSGWFSKLFIDYTHRATSLQPYFLHFPDAAGYRDALNNSKSLQNDSSILATVIREQYAAAGIHPPQQLLDSLSEPETLTVCTGHQLVIAGSPVYFIYKIASTIALAKKLSADMNRAVVPVFWMATEDHDVDEIRQVHIFGKSFGTATTFSGAVGRMKTDEIQDLISALAALWPEGEVATAIQEIYRLGRTMSAATRDFVHRCFGEEIVVLDPDDTQLKRQFISVMQDDLFSGTAFRLVNETNSALEQLGYNIQVKPRPINVFYLSDAARARIEREGDRWFTVDQSKTWNSRELLEELNAHPENFSPNVVLRPLYQQRILRNIAYIGGPGELAYWLQYRSVFAHYGIYFPVLHPRWFAARIDDAMLQKMSRMELKPEQFFGLIDELVKEYVAKHSTVELSTAEEAATLNTLYNDLKLRAKQVDATLEKTVEAELAKTLAGLQQLEGKMMRAAKQRSDADLQQLRKIVDKLMPGGTPQDRVESVLSWKHPFILAKQLPEAIDPLDFSIHIWTD